MTQTKNVSGKSKLMWLDDKDLEFCSEWLSLTLSMFRRFWLDCLFLDLEELTTSTFANLNWYSGFRFDP
jgi:hypothetical protein